MAFNVAKKGPLKTENVDTTSIMLAWKPPKSWSKAAPYVRADKQDFTVKNLIQRKEYEFKVDAELLQSCYLHATPHATSHPPSELSWQSDHDESLPDARATCRVAATTIIWTLLGTTLMKGYCSWLRKCQLSENTMWPCQFWISRTTTTTTTTTTTATFNNNLHQQQPPQTTASTTTSKIPRS